MDYVINAWETKRAKLTLDVASVQWRSSHTDSFYYFHRLPHCLSLYVCILVPACYSRPHWNIRNLSIFRWLSLLVSRTVLSRGLCAITKFNPFNSVAIYLLILHWKQQKYFAILHMEQLMPVSKKINQMGHKSRFDPSFPISLLYIIHFKLREKMINDAFVIIFVYIINPIIYALYLRLIFRDDGAAGQLWRHTSDPLGLSCGLGPKWSNLRNPWS